MARKPKVNANGLTLNQWIAAVGQVPILDAPKLSKAWERGEDPAEWRAYYAYTRRVEALERLPLLTPEQDAEMRRLRAWLEANGAPTPAAQEHHMCERDAEEPCPPMMQALTLRKAGERIPKGTLFEVVKKSGAWWSDISRGAILEAKEDGHYGMPIKLSLQGWAEGRFTMTPTQTTGGKILLESAKDPRTITVILHTAERAADLREEAQLRDVLMNGNRHWVDGEPTEKEAEASLRAKFKYNDAKIRKLRTMRRQW